MATLNIKKFPDDVYTKLQQRALSYRRTVSEEVICLLQSIIEKPKQQHSILELRGLGKKKRGKTFATRHINQERESW